MRALFIVSLVLLAFSGAAWAKKKPSGKNMDLNLLWKARGLQAMERIDELVKKGADSKGKKLSKKEHCELISESGYSAFANPALSFVHQSSDDMEAYILVLNGTGGTGDLTQVSFMYEKGKLLPSAVKVPSLAKGAQVLMAPPGKVFNVLYDGCVFVVSFETPLRILVDEQI